MQVASLFAKLGLTGGKAAADECLGLKGSLDSTGKTITTTQQALDHLSMSLGMSTKSLAAYQTVAKSVGVSNQELLASFNGLKNAASKAILDKVPRAHVARVAKITGGGMEKEDLGRYAADPALLAQKLQTYARLEHNAGQREKTLKAFGLTPQMSQAVTRQAFRPEALEKVEKAPGYNPKELGEAKSAWGGLGKEAGGALKTLDEGIRKTASSSFAAKAAVLGLFYALQQMMSKSGKMGTNLVNTGALTGLDPQTIQRHQYAGRQAGASNEDVTGGLKALQDTAFNTVIGGQAPEFAALVNKRVGGMTEADFRKYAEDPTKLLQQLQLFAQRETNVPLRNRALKSFGLNDSMIAAVTRNAFRPEVMAKAPTYSNKEVKSLDKANVDIANLGNKFEMAVGHFTAAHGSELAKNIGPIIDSLLKLANALMDFATKAKIFDAIGLVIKGWAAIFGGAADVAGTIADTMDDKDPKKKAKAQEKIKKNSQGLVDTFVAVHEYLWEAGKKEVEDFGRDKLQKIGILKPPGPGDKPKPSTNTLGPVKTEPEVNPAAKKASPPVKEEGGGGGGGDGGGEGSDFGSGGGEEDVDPRMPVVLMPQMVAAPPPPAVSSSSSTQHVEINQELNFQHEGKEAGQTAQSVSKAVRDAFRQMPALSKGS